MITITEDRADTVSSELIKTSSFVNFLSKNAWYCPDNE